MMFYFIGSNMLTAEAAVADLILFFYTVKCVKSFALMCYNNCGRHQVFAEDV